jgi:hypothetical protein
LVLFSCTCAASVFWPVVDEERISIAPEAGDDSWKKKAPPESCPSRRRPLPPSLPDEVRGFATDISRPAMVPGPVFVTCVLKPRDPSGAAQRPEMTITSAFGDVMPSRQVRRPEPSLPPVWE